MLMGDHQDAAEAVMAVLPSKRAPESSLPLVRVFSEARKMIPLAQSALCLSVSGKVIIG